MAGWTGLLYPSRTPSLVYTNS